MTAPGQAWLLHMHALQEHLTPASAWKWLRSFRYADGFTPQDKHFKSATRTHAVALLASNNLQILGGDLLKVPTRTHAVANLWKVYRAAQFSMHCYHVSACINSYLSVCSYCDVAGLTSLILAGAEAARTSTLRSRSRLACCDCDVLTLHRAASGNGTHVDTA